MIECVACSPGQMLFPIPSPRTKRKLTNLGRFTHWLHHRLKIIVEFEKKEKKNPLFWGCLQYAYVNIKNSEIKQAGKKHMKTS